MSKRWQMTRDALTAHKSKPAAGRPVRSAATTAAASSSAVRANALLSTGSVIQPPLATSASTESIGTVLAASFPSPPSLFDFESLSSISVVSTKTKDLRKCKTEKSSYKQSSVRYLQHVNRISSQFFQEASDTNFNIADDGAGQYYRAA